MEKPSWEKLVDKKLDSQKNLIYTLFVLLTISLGYIYFQSVELNKEISDLNVKVESLEQLEENLENKIVANEQKLENSMTTLSRNLINQIYSVSDDVSYLVKKVQECETKISDISSYLRSLSRKITIDYSWYSNSYYLNVTDFDGGLLFGNSNGC
tara:strand:+ start:120 stop:584 length:465 start_codon:yes stop_codon:yes gene_type:complete